MYVRNKKRNPLRRLDYPDGGGEFYWQHFSPTYSPFSDSVRKLLLRNFLKARPHSTFPLFSCAHNYAGNIFGAAKRSAALKKHFFGGGGCRRYATAQMSRSWFFFFQSYVSMTFVKDAACINYFRKKHRQRTRLFRSGESGPTYSRLYFF